MTKEEEVQIASAAMGIYEEAKTHIEYDYELDVFAKTLIITCLADLEMLHGEKKTSEFVTKLFKNGLKL